MNWNEEMPGFGQDYSISQQKTENAFGEGWRRIEQFDVPEEVMSLLSQDLVVHSYLYKELKPEGEQYQFVVSSQENTHKTFEITITKKPGQAPVPESSSS